MTGGQASTGKQIDNAIKLYMQQNGDTVAGQKIEIILKDDGAVPDNTKRIAQELIVNDKVDIHRGLWRHAGRPCRGAARDAGQDAANRDGCGHLDHHRALALHRAHQLSRLAQSSVIIGDWAAKNGIKKVATLTIRLRARQ